MTSTEWIDMIRLIPEAEHTKLVIVLKNGTELCVDTLYRFEHSFLVMRGRQGGTIDESRAFLVPYDQMMCVRLDRVVKIDELDAMFMLEAQPVTRPTETPLVPVSATPTPTSAPTDPAAASRLLLERIRAVRASSARSMGMPSQMD